MASSLIDIYEEYREDPSFSHLRKGKNPLVEGEGSGSAVAGGPIAFIIGEAPGAQEVIHMRPFVGQSGMILRQLMEIAGLHSWFKESSYRPNCWLTNTVKYRPPRNRTPTLNEINDSRQYLRQEWLAVGKPNNVICVGSVACQAVWGEPFPLIESAGTAFIKHHNKTDVIPMAIWPMLHPAYGMRNPKVRPLMETHWNALGQWLRNQGYVNNQG